MKRIVLTTVLAAALAPSGLSSASVPRIAIATSSPLVVAGSHFAAREYVTVTFEQTTRHARATPFGNFRATFTGVTSDRCSGYRSVAAGAGGNRAVLVQSRVMCAPAKGQ